MKNKYITPLIIVLLIFFINTSQALLTNPSFELDTSCPPTGWTSIWGDQVCGYATENAYDGDNVARIASGDLEGVYQSVNFDDIDNVSVWVWCSGAGCRNILFLNFVEMGSSTSVYRDGNGLGWGKLTINTSTKWGEGNIQIRGVNYCNPCYFDLISDGEYESSPAFIEFNPDNDIQNTTNSNSIDFYEGDNYSYPFFYVKLWKQIYYNDSWSDKVIAKQHLIGYPEYCGGLSRCWYSYDFMENVITTTGSRDFIGGSIPCSSNEKCKLTADIINWGNMSIMDTDTLIYDANYTYEPPIDPLPTIPLPTPTPTPTITPLPTITPTPLPTPLIDNGTTNYSINTSKMGDYYSSVDNYMGYLENSTIGALNFLLIPVTGITNLTNEINNSVTENLNYSDYKIPLIEMIYPIISYFPSQVNFLINYFLTLCLILRILKE